MSVEEHGQSFGESRRLPKIADRRQEQRSDTTVSTRNPSLEAETRDNLDLEDYLKSTAVGEALEQSLTRLLSTRSVVSTSSSFAQRQQAAVGTITAFREIGTGSIGKVFEHPGTIWAYKLPLTDDVSKLWNNYIIDRRIEHSFEHLGPLAGQVDIPRAVWYAQAGTAEFWDAKFDRFPLTDVFSSRRRDILCIEQIKDIGLEAHDLAFAMADALTILHWHTKIDAMDIEFVLGSSPQDDQIVRRQFPLEKLASANTPKSIFEYVTNSNPNFGRRMTSLWLLDFDACKDISVDQVGVNMACKAFVETDPYCPRPHSSEIFAQQLWTSFDNRYIATAQEILDESFKNWPIQFLDGITMILDRQSIPRPLVGPTVYQLMREPSSQHTRGRYGGRGQSSSSRYPTAYNLRSSVGVNTSTGAGNSADSEYLGMGRGRGDSGDAGTQPRSRGRSRHGRHEVGSRGRIDNRRGSGPFASGPWRGQ